MGTGQDQKEVGIGYWTGPEGGGYWVLDRTRRRWVLGTGQEVEQAGQSFLYDLPHTLFVRGGGICCILQFMVAVIERSLIQNKGSLQI